MSFDADVRRATENLRALNRAMSGENLARAVSEAGDVFVKEAQGRVPDRTGKMRSNIQHEAHQRGRTYAVEKVFVNSRYAHLVEYGHRSPRQPVTPKQAKALQTDLDRFAMSSRGGAASERPFMRPAADAAASSMGREIENEVRRAAGRSRR